MFVSSTYLWFLPDNLRVAFFSLFLTWELGLLSIFIQSYYDCRYFSFIISVEALTRCLSVYALPAYYGLIGKGYRNFDRIRAQSKINPLILSSDGPVALTLMNRNSSNKTQHCIALLKQMKWNSTGSGLVYKVLNATWSPIKRCLSLYRAAGVKSLPWCTTKPTHDSTTLIFFAFRKYQWDLSVGF